MISVLCICYIYLETNTFQDFISQCSDQESRDHSGDQKCRCVVDQTGSHGDQAGNEQLSDIMGDTAGNTDTEDAEVGFFFITVMTVRLKAAPARLYRILKRFPNMNPMIKIRMTETRAASFQVYFSRINRTARLASPSFIPGIPAKKGISDST